MFLDVKIQFAAFCLEFGEHLSICIACGLRSWEESRCGLKSSFDVYHETILLFWSERRRRIKACT
jgi:hypothetical protein